MRSPEEVKTLLVRQWVRKAEQDLAASEALLSADPSLSHTACFHAQQAVEKYLKALLTWHQVEFPKTHAIEQLLDLLNLVDTETASRLSQAANLTPYAVDLRYPGDQPEPDEDEARAAVDIARSTCAVIIDLLSTL